VLACQLLRLKHAWAELRVSFSSSSSSTAHRLAALLTGGRKERANHRLKPSFSSSSISSSNTPQLDVGRRGGLGGVPGFSAQPAVAIITCCCCCCYYYYYDYHSLSLYWVATCNFEKHLHGAKCRAQACAQHTAIPSDWGEGGASLESSEAIELVSVPPPLPSCPH